MNKSAIRVALLAAAYVASLAGCDSSVGSGPTRTTNAAPETAQGAVAADNTGNNRGDAGREAMTPIDQSESSEHIKRTADIRQAVLADDTLSTNADNCKIITDEAGRVWLRGVVDSAGEKALVEQIARRIAGTNTVMNELEVK